MLCMMSRFNCWLILLVMLNVLEITQSLNEKPALANCDR